MIIHFNYNKLIKSGFLILFNLAYLEKNYDNDKIRNVPCINTLALHNQMIVGALGKVGTKLATVGKLPQASPFKGAAVRGRPKWR